MVHNTVYGTYTETYDLNTVNGQLSILGIHTPQSSSVKRLFHGFYEQYRKMKVLGCNLRMICASTLPLSPNLVGTGSGQVAARDVLNPILFKACTGEGMNVLLDQVYNSSEETANTGSISEHIDSGSRAINSYYSLLADDSFRKEHPQKGITVMGLKPYVHKVVTTQPFKWSASVGSGSGSALGEVSRPIVTPGTNIDTNAQEYGFGGQSGSKNYDTDPVNPSVFVSNGLTEMPWIDTAYSTVVGTGDDSRKLYALQTNIPRVYMGVLVLPPSDSAVNLYYRMQIVWHIAFRDFRPSQDLAPVDIDYPVNTVDELQDYSHTYWNLYHTGSKLDKDFGSIDTTGIEDVELIGEKVQ